MVGVRAILVLLVTSLLGSLGQYDMEYEATTEFACQEGCVPCTDPRGCPDLIVSGMLSALGIVLDTRNFTRQECDVEEGFATEGMQRLLRFSYGVPNIGPGSLILGNNRTNEKLFDCNSCRDPPCVIRRYADFRLIPFEAYGDWESVRASNERALSSDLLAQNPNLEREVTRGEQNGYCVQDVLSCAESEPFSECPPGTPALDSSFPLPNGTECNNQGISPGWMDFYDSRLGVTFIQAPEEGGVYVLEIEANPLRWFQEANYTNNLASFCVNIPPMRNSSTGFAPRPDCVTPLQTTNATECDMCEAFCTGLGFCSREDQNERCNADNCFCADVCQYPPSQSSPLP